MKIKRIFESKRNYKADKKRQAKKYKISQQNKKKEIEYKQSQKRKIIY